MDGNQRKLRNLLLYIGIPVVVLFIIILLFNNRVPQTAAYKYSDILDYFQSQEVTGYRLNLGTGDMAIQLESGETIGYQLPSVDLFYMDVRDSIQQYNEEHPDSKMVQDIIRPQETSWLISLLPTLIMFAVLIIFWVVMMRRLGSSMGGDKQMNFGKAKIKQMSDEKRKTTFADVAGADEEKEELREIVEFLKNPSKYNSLGARIPKGVLLVGPPGTGKTLLARAVAGEAGVPFFSISGSDFVEMFVGVGASRVRDLFDKAKKNHPCIIFIDEIDAVGRQRGAGLGGGHDEREQTLNQLLVEMDGFGANEGVIMIAATNRPDILDPALMRPGRFDRQVMVGYPDIKGREEILRVHAKGKPLAPDVVLSTIAKSTAGFTGADLENLLNEAALLAARKNHRAITMEEIEEATIKVVVGTEKKSRVMSEKEKKLTAYHEAGHALATYYCKTQDPVHQISIIPRGMAGGYTMHLPTEDRSYKSRDEMREELVVLLGGRVAEALVLDDISTGASNDIERATKIARAMVTKYGMSEKLGPITYGSDDSNPFLGKEMGHISNYSEQTASEIDEEIQSIISTAYQKTEQILRDHIDELHRLAGVLYEKEKIDGVEFQQVMDGNLLPSGMAAQALGQEPQAALPQDGGDADQPQEDAGAPEQD
ncbi:ATP-dependent zinc metalloprotease FtsH [Acutalibacter sp. LFL-21]|uniref:ATP-dependent zinc metalloprotease FtsH n=1 Tax=Acutalibacter sp. LFL-21 TaxID=2983399 RepID=UPI0021D67DBD|nr:ATP-dependent zinc metalloprotease FtsH [Acutalibacter sp. LFL-21]MCU7652074.1 ATP-dependent zinc metalloprotease FtsH [Acutalibacter sp. LFL-21]